MPRSRERIEKMNAINLTKDDVMCIIENYIREKNMKYVDLEKQLNISKSSIGQIKSGVVRLYKVWKWADVHREYLDSDNIKNLQNKHRNENLEVLSHYFKAWRLSHGFTQSQVAQNCNYSRSLIAMAERGDVRTVDGVLDIMRQAMENTPDDEIFQTFYNIPKEKRTLFVKLCKNIANTLAEDISLEEEGD